ncbi:MAG: DUF6089 family protein [Flavobacteriaceae bacterium]|nr:DUF6089 family protein [Flavobacteriaceae bacterium]
MKYLLFFNLFSFLLISAQRHEIGAMAGSSNLIGDIGRSDYIQLGSEGITRTPLMLGAFYKRNLNPYQGIKLSFSSHYVYFNDYKAKETYRNKRGIENSSNILEASLSFEYNFFPINNEIKNSMWSPYVFAGVSGILYNIPSTSYTVESSNNAYIISSKIQTLTNKYSLAIPFGVGMKYKFNYNWTIYGELSLRYTFTDNLDYNNIENTIYKVSYQNETENAKEAFKQFIENNKAGNIHSKDWLNSVSIGISYSFGRPPCYCN